MATNVEFADLSSREIAIVEFAVKVAQMTPLLNSDYEALAGEGLDMEDAWYIGAIVAFFALSNRMAHVCGMQPNKEFYRMGRELKQ